MEPHCYLSQVCQHSLLAPLVLLVPLTLVPSLKSLCMTIWRELSLYQDLDGQSRFTNQLYFYFKMYHYHPG